MWLLPSIYSSDIEMFQVMSEGRYSGTLGLCFMRSAGKSKLRCSNLAFGLGSFYDLKRD